MRNPTRRNRNIGTANQGFGQDNRLTNASPNGNILAFYERLERYHKENRVINGHEFLFIGELTREHSVHSCSLDDVAKMIAQIPCYDYGALKYIIFRQPKRKEEIVAPVWGRLVYSYEFENEYNPAIILDAIDVTRKFSYSKKQRVDFQKEFERLKIDGHIFEEDKRKFTASFNPDYCRNTQLYRTLVHEFGHYVHYLDFVERPAVEDEPYEERELRAELYFSIPQDEKEKFAHRYADELRAKLIATKVIPFKQL